MFWTRSMPQIEKATIRRNRDIFGRLLGPQSSVGTHARFPGCNIWADDEGAVLTSEIPGFALEDIAITVSGREITIKGACKNQEPEKGKTLRRERSCREFERAFQLPFHIDSSKVAAKLTKGILEVTMPRAESDKPRTINVSAG